MIDYLHLKGLATELRRPASTLVALAPTNDPFYAGAPGRRAEAEWFASLWDRLDLGSRAQHLRRVHYILISQETPILHFNGTPYQNTTAHWYALASASKNARYLDLVPIDGFEDRRNPDPIIHLVEPEDAELLITGDRISSDLPELPRLELGRPVVAQRYQVELWCEKSTMNDVLEPLARQYGLNVVTGLGELSISQCRDLVRRVKESGRETRILYVSDFDPAGDAMPVSAARKIEFLIRETDLANVQLRPVALTLEQCQRYRLPRTPIKETELRGPAFELRFGEGATELDALEALHPGELRRILTREVRRYHDGELDESVGDACDEVDDRLDEINDAVLGRHAAEIDALRNDYRSFVERFNSLRRAIRDELQAEAPDIDDIEWPVPEEGDEDEDPLFDSAREYVEQIDRYKEHQGKPTARRGAR